MKVIEVKTIEIKPYENNPRLNDEAIDAVAESIKRFGFQQPILVDEDMVIIAGHTRLKARKRLHLKKVPVIVNTELTEEKKAAYRLVDNKTGELATWDELALQEELDAILNYDMADFGFDFDDEDLEIADDAGERQTDIIQIGFKLHEIQRQHIQRAIDELKGVQTQTYGNINAKGNAIYEAVRQWLKAKEAKANET